MKNYYKIPDHYPEDIKELIQWTRDHGYDGLELYQDLKCICGIDANEEFRIIISAEKYAEEFYAKWGHIL